MLDKLVVDDHPRVRVEAMRALAKIPSARSAELVLTVADSIKLNAEGKPEDPFLDYACWLSINDLAEPWLAALKSGAWKPEGREKQLEFGLKAIEPRLASEVLAQLLGDQPLPQNGSGPWIELIGAAGSPKELRRLFDQLLKGEFVEPAAIRAFTALADASRLRNVKPDGELASFGPMLRSNGEKVRLAALQLAGTWKLAKFIPQISQSAGDINASAVVRSAAFTALRDISGSGAADALAPLCAKDRPLEIRRAAIVALAGVNLNRAAPLAAEVLAATEEEDKALELWRDLLKVKGAGKAIGAKVGQASRLPSGEPPSTPAAENGRDARPTLSASVARAGTLAAQEGGRTEPELLAALAVSSTPDTSLINITPELIQELAQRAVKEGDPARGELIYRRASLACTSCHAIGGAGGKVGPDMTSIGGSAPVDYLVESLLLPNAKIKEGYHSVLVETKDEQEFSGILVRESEQEVVIRNAANVEISVAKNKIARRSTGLSLMPSGLMESLPMNERLDLFRFLSELGKPGPYDAAKSGVARSWKILGGTHRVEQFGIEKLVSGDLTDADWKPVASLVDGRLLREEIKEQTKLGINLGLVGVYAGTQFNVATAGAVGFQLDGAPQVQAWIDGKSVSAKGAIKADLSAGKHTIILRFDPKDLPEQVRLKSGDVTFVGN
jgi:putative heme-binding domain-containing protein